MEIKPNTNNSQHKNPLSSNQKVADSASVVFNLKRNKTVTVKKSKVKQITKGLAEIAFSLGATSDPEEYAETLSEDIYDSMKEANQKIKNSKNKKSN